MIDIETIEIYPHDNKGETRETAFIQNTYKGSEHLLLQLALNCHVKRRSIKHNYDHESNHCDIVVEITTSLNALWSKMFLGQDEIIVNIYGEKIRCNIQNIQYILLFNVTTF